MQAPHASGALRSISLTNPLHRPLTTTSPQKYPNNDLQIVRAGRKESLNTRFWNVPNIMSVGRLLSVPPFIAAMAMKQVHFPDTHNMQIISLESYSIGIICCFRLNRLDGWLFSSVI